MANLNVCAVWPCGLCVLILTLLAGFRSYVARSCPSLPVKLPAKCYAIMKTLSFRSYTPLSWAMKGASSAGFLSGFSSRGGKRDDFRIKRGHVLLLHFSGFLS